MSHFSLATRYRPQSFAEVIGQDEIKKILSYAAEENKIAPAYLLSGTRGVGKTTVARIFAKALNCQKAPIADPCNVCTQCKSITQGCNVDVIEIDGASNRGIDDARRLRDAVAYVPMEGRYKVFIIDEAHMLTRESFNALLKTLEEPPPYSTFIFATTEAHKFPPTIVSRCQHFVFKSISESRLVQHMLHVLNTEGYQYEQAALTLIARRASGSVRDSISLLSQSLMFSSQCLTSDIIRQVLGLADQEWYENFLSACKDQDYATIVSLNQSLHEKGIDIGFFLKEFTLFWRNLFLLKQLGMKATSMIGFSPEEAERLAHLSEYLTITYIHAAWQMVIENQRQILMSLEPPVALELLLLNLALLPKLISLEQLSKIVISSPQSVLPKTIEQALSKKDDTIVKKDSLHNAGIHKEHKEPGIEKKRELENKKDNQAPHILALKPTWEGFLEFCVQHSLNSLVFFLNKLNGSFKDTILKIYVNSSFQYNQLILNENFKMLQDAVLSYAGELYVVQVIEIEKPAKLESELKKNIEAHPVIQTLQKNFDAELLRCIPIREILS